MDVSVSQSIVVPPSPGATYNKIWITKVEVYTPTPTSNPKVVVYVVPYKDDTGDLLPSQLKTLVFDNIPAPAFTDTLSGSLARIGKNVENRLSLLPVIFN